MNGLSMKLSARDALNSIGENIIIADTDYKITWMNTKAAKSLSAIAPLYGLTNAEEMIGLNMDFFHKKPEHQQLMMEQLQEGHRARITIKNKFIADIVVTPIKNSQNNEQVEGYMVMLLDVTSQAEEEKRKDALIEDLSVPLLNIWEKTIVLPLAGVLDWNRGELVLSTVLEECTSQKIEYFLISLRGISHFDDSVRDYLQKLADCLKLIGVKCIIVGIKPELALSIRELKDMPIFRDAHAGLKHIMKLQEKESSSSVLRI
ncbi:STAS domain-containing protein [Pseudobacillus wudalianchiensis]|uniref:RsbR, positive regulator of sigma-B n=1 Tax=Pseudobacillus wudalianchiensis TaxID=1743143 RepID=A0A1B9AAD2_9BACI|nr:STAS domain-containing protein [Bacillus wudalianchiensis]OCA80800.1 RsbR, positive regulator of sigma-B [Bacillus wudalianchiensis]